MVVWVWEGREVKLQDLVVVEAITEAEEVNGCLFYIRSSFFLLPSVEILFSLFIAILFVHVSSQQQMRDVVQVAGLVIPPQLRFTPLVQTEATDMPLLHRTLQQPFTTPVLFSSTLYQPMRLPCLSPCTEPKEATEERVLGGKVQA